MYDNLETDFLIKLFFPLQLVRNSALFALGQFAEHLQPDISKYHAELLPVLFQYLTQVSMLLDAA